jgi:hypothetical protein
MRIVVVFAALLLVSACGALPPLAMIDGASVVGSDKTLGDNAISIYTGKNCSTIRVEQGLAYCEEDEVVPAPEAYCYRTLAKVTFYDRPDSYRGGHQRVGDNDHNLVGPKR